MDGEPKTLPDINPYLGWSALDRLESPPRSRFYTIFSFLWSCLVFVCKNNCILLLSESGFRRAA